ncbi:MAG: hypothetical protein MJ175_01720 [Clostridia bacterium]|nr:hypothetical protein [Clostridia bacterium]
MKNQKTAAILRSISLLISVLLSAIPGAAAAANPNDPAKHACYSLIPLKNGNIGPFPAAILSIVLLVFAVDSLIKKKKPSRAEMLLSYLAFLCSVLPLYLGGMTVIGWCITAALGLAVIFAKSGETQKDRGLVRGLQGRRRTK